MSGKAFENEYISRREAIKARKRSCDKNCLECDFAIEGDSWCKGEVFVVDLLRIPAADVRSVVTCADCKHNNACLTQAFVEEASRVPFDRNTFFCVDGKRADDA